MKKKNKNKQKIYCDFVLFVYVYNIIKIRRSKIVFGGWNESNMV